MKRVIFSVSSTIIGLVALLSFKSQSQTAVDAVLPSAAAGAPTVSTPTTGTPTTGTGSTGAGAAPSSAAAPTTYRGTAAQTRYGTVQVAVTVNAGRITNVSFLQLTSHDGRSAEINSRAAPVLLKETLSAQSGNIDTVSGATYTSDGYVTSLQSALDQAGIK
jgi:uncharacterized protein with FMN-binding domain